MISSQRFILKTFNSIINFNNKILTNSCAYTFSNDDSKYHKYQFPFNFNRQQFKGYIKKVQKAKKQIAQIQKIQTQNILPRRKRRVYDRPKHNTNLTDYAAWRLCDPQHTQFKYWDHALPVVAKLQLQPKWVIHAFGKGLISLNNRLNSHRQYIFQDNNFSKFILYQYRNTTFYKQNIPNYDYQNQQHLRPEMRKVKRLSPEQFWQSQQKFQFRVNCTTYAQYLKFTKWIQNSIENRKAKLSYDQQIDTKFGKAACFNEKQDVQSFVPRTPFIMHVKPEDFQIKKQQKEQKQGKSKKEQKTKKQSSKNKQQSSSQKEQGLKQSQQVKSKYNFSYKLDEQYRKQHDGSVFQKKVESY